ncbi:MAG: hypothetical protein JWO79_2078 [Actinomycetia bacterium]|jgi:hypothetical protein|nr:hypothetical protein [Actinomycetes bacterium]
MTLATRWTVTARRRSGQALILLLVLAFAAALLWRFTEAASARSAYAVPQDGQIESSLGVRFTQAAVVGDGGIVELRYTVLDTERASAFQNDVKHPPRLTDERDGTVAWRTALMKQGHELRPGQTYYILYLNNRGAIHSGDKIAIAAAKGTLAHVPVR